MALDRAGGATPLDGLRDYYGHVDAVCNECGHEDAEGTWNAETDGKRIVYRHQCPVCGVLRVRTVERRSR